MIEESTISVFSFMVINAHSLLLTSKKFAFKNWGIEYNWLTSNIVLYFNRHGYYLSYYVQKNAIFLQYTWELKKYKSKYFTSKKKTQQNPAYVQ